MAVITVPIGPQEKVKWHRAAITAVAYPGAAQFTGITFRAEKHLIMVESSTRIASFSIDGTNDFLVLNTAHFKAVALDSFHAEEIFIKMDDAAGATVCILATA